MKDSQPEPDGAHRIDKYIKANNERFSTTRNIAVELF